MDEYDPNGPVNGTSGRRPADPEMRELAMRRREDDEKLLMGLSKMAQRVDILEATLESRLHLSIEEAITKAVKMVFSNLGVDVDSPTDLEQFRSDLRFGKAFRLSVERGFYAVIAAIAGAVGLAFWVVLQDKLVVLHDKIGLKLKTSSSSRYSP